VSSSTFISLNPASGIQIAEYPTHSAEQITQFLEQANLALSDWSLSSLERRSALLLSIASAIRSVLPQAALIATQEMGKPIAQSRAELEKCAKTMEYYAREGARFLANEPIATEARKSFVSYQPLGVVLAIMPWNFPYWQVFRAMAAIIMSGNTMLLKHAANVSGCALMIQEILNAAGAPKGLFQALLLPSSAVPNLIAHPYIAAVTFTGSTEVGRKVASLAAYHLKKQVLELGGSDAYVVFEDADIDYAVQTCFDARFVNTGQSCVAAKRFIVLASVRQAFETKMLALIQNVKMGNPIDESMHIGPMARVDLRDELHQQVQQSIAQGAQLVCGGYIPETEGAFYPATLLTGVQKGMPAYDDEMFGPVAVIIEAKDEQDAIRIANDSEFGLGTALFSQNIERVTYLAQNIMQSGACFVNAAVHSDPRLPFGGIKNSGYGRELSSFSLREFVNIKTIVVH
jgi:succinate-semialdehyde dehydrogenase/glutarate-semialdehyde dehydrogenase